MLHFIIAALAKIPDNTCKDPISKYGHIRRYRGFEIQHTNVLGGCSSGQNVRCVDISGTNKKRRVWKRVRLALGESATPRGVGFQQGEKRQIHEEA